MVASGQIYSASPTPPRPLYPRAGALLLVRYETEWAQCRTEQFRKRENLLLLPRFQPRTVQPASSRCTGYAIPALYYTGVRVLSGHSVDVCYVEFDIRAIISKAAESFNERGVYPRCRISMDSINIYQVAVQQPAIPKYQH
jgi:hypothetical protein